MLASESTPAVWKELTHEIEECTRCPLHATRTHVVVYRGSLAPRIVFVGEAPGAAEDRQGLPFVGASGRRLDVAISTLGLAPDQYGILNLLKCRPPNNRFDPKAAATCRPFLDRQLAILRPQLLVTLGGSALRAFLPEASAMLESSGRPRRAGNWTIFPLLHPAATMRSRRFQVRWTEDLSQLKEHLARSPGESLLP